MEQSALLPVWTRIVSELAFNQDRASQEFSGQVVNPICGMVYILDTACAAKVFAVEYYRTEDEKWLTRAKAALESISIHDLFSGLHEPIWDVLGWHEVPGSLAATGIATDALWDSMDLLGTGLDEKDCEPLLTFLTGCLHGKGRFAHSTVRQGQQPRDIQNTTAVALYLLEYIAKKIPQLEHPLLRERGQAIRHLSNGQDKSGFWPYCYSGWLGKSTAAAFPILKKIPVIRGYFLNTDFGDTMHQAMTLYFVVKYLSLSPNHKHLEVISRGWEWINRHFINNNEEGLAIDWSWEPVPTFPRYCNFRDTNTYFWILGLLPNLENLGVVNKDESAKTIEGLLRHINDNLLEEEGEIPGIVPHEGPPEILRNILPMFDQGVAWKGSFLAEIIRQTL